jgi:protein-tyrosine phosphatase
MSQGISMRVDRHLDWDGCFNVRDLGSQRTSAGRTTRWGALVRADSLDHLSPAGWSALQAYGIRTIVHLRNERERAAHVRLRPADISLAPMPLDDVADTAFWAYRWANELDGSRLFYQLFLDHKPEQGR